MKILIGIDSLVTGGKERRLLELIKGLAVIKELDCELIIFSKVIEYKEIKTLPIPIHYVVRRHKKDIFIFFQLYRLVQKIQPDVMQSWSSMVSIYMAPIAKMLDVKFINAIVADAPYRLKPWSSKWFRSKVTFPFSDAIVGNSYAGLKAYHAPSDKSFCIYNGISAERISSVKNPQAVRKEFAIQTPYVVGMVASFRGAKDYETFLKAAMKVLNGRKDVTFLAVGDGKELPRYQLMVRDKYKNNIVFTGRQTDVESIVNIFDIGVLITDYQVHGEGISNAILEYMILGKPVIASDTGGTAELVANEQTGFLIRHKETEVLAEKINYLLDHPAMVSAFGKRGKEVVLKQFTTERMTREFVGLYHKLLMN